ncbi:MAG: hypothetical protein HC836_35640 [Richelia sp. RM2_1_2]|nr:hypothetical protein [Richelia sp. RM2_1_2]
MIIYTNTKSKVKKSKHKSKTLLESERRHQEFLHKIGYTGVAKKKTLPPIKLPNLTAVKIPTSDQIPFGVVCAKKSIDDWRWQKNIEESQNTIEEIERKKKRVAIAYNKGSYQYITGGADPSTFGKK